MSARLFLGLREGIRRFLALEEPGGAAAAPSAAEPEVGAPAARPTEVREFVSAGRFGLIGLQDLRETLGPRWPALRERVSVLAEAVISRHLQPGDVFELQEDGAYVVLFARLNKAEADFKCRVIGKEITQKLLGSDSVRLADVSSVAVEVSRSALASGSADSLEDAFYWATPDISSDPASPRPTSPPRHAGEVPTSASPHRLRDPRAVSRGAALTAAITHASRPAPSGPAWCYAPVWDFSSNALVRFRLTSADWRAYRAEEGPHEGRRTVAFDTDMRAISKAVGDLSTLTAEGRRLFVICVVSQTSLGVEWRRNQLVELLSAAPLALRSLLQVDVFSPVFDPGQGLARFFEALSLLKVRTGVTVPLESRRAVHSAGMPLNACSAEAPAYLPQAEVLSLLNTFARRSAQVGLDAAVHGLDSRALVIGGMAAGIRYLSGEAVHPTTHDLGQGVRFEARNLYRDLLRMPAA